MNSNDESWAAGYLSGLGSILVIPNGTTRLVIRTYRDGEALTRFADLFGINARDFEVRGKRGLVVEVSGRTLNDIMRRVWPELTHSRKREYALARKKADGLMRELKAAASLTAGLTEG